MEKIFLTGITGFIGSELARRLSDTNEYEIHGLIRHHSGDYAPAFQDYGPNVRLITGNLLDHVRIRELILNLQPTYVIHLGAFTPVRYSFESPIEYQQIDYLATINLAHSVLDLPSGHFRKFIFASTMEVYGWQTSREPFPENIPLHPASPYAVSKAAAEKYITMAGKAYGLPYFTLRPCNTYGRRHNTSFVTEYLITSMLQGRSPSIGSPNTVRDLLYVDDHIEAYLTALRSSEIKGIFNFGWGSIMTMWELAKMIKALTGYTGDIKKGFPEDYPFRPTVEDFLSLNTMKAQNKLGWTPKVPLEEGLQKTIDFWRNKVSGTEI